MLVDNLIIGSFFSYKGKLCKAIDAKLSGLPIQISELHVWERWL